MGDLLKRCTSCGRNTKEFAEFPCPDCKEKVIRCNFCRKNNVVYKCSCGYEGP